MKFRIFKKTSEFYWSNNKVIYSIFVIGLASIYFKDEILNIERNLFDKVIFGAMIITLICGVILKFVGLTILEPLGGKFDGELIFHFESVQINEETFSLENIRNLEISSDDYCGKLVGTSRGNFNGALSNGVSNYFKMKLYSGEIRMLNFELNDSLDFIDMKRELIHYYLNGKIEFDNLAKLLSETSSSDKVWLKQQIEQSSTNR